MFDFPTLEELYQQDDGNINSMPGGGNPIAPNGGRMTTRTSGTQFNPAATKLRKGKPLPADKAKKPSILKDANNG